MPPRKGYRDITQLLQLVRNDSLSRVADKIHGPEMALADAPGAVIGHECRDNA